MNYIITILFAIVNAFYDRDKTIKGVHYWRFISRFVFLCGLAILTNWDTWLIIGLMTLSNGLLFWMVFDPFLNYLKGQPFFYIGSEAGLDKFGRRFFTPKRFYIFKVILFIIVNLILWLKLS